MKKSYLTSMLWMLGVPSLVVPSSALIQGIKGTDLSAEHILSTVVYGLLGIFLFIVGYLVFDRFFQLDLRKELVEDQNRAIGVMMAGVFLSLAIIVASAIV